MKRFVLALALMFGVPALMPAITQAQEQTAQGPDFSVFSTHPFWNTSVGVVVIEGANRIVDNTRVKENYRPGVSFIVDGGFTLGNILRLGGTLWLFDSDSESNDDDNDNHDDDDDGDDGEDNDKRKIQAISGGGFVGLQFGSLESDASQSGVFDTGIYYIDYGLLRTREESERDDRTNRRKRRDRYLTHMIRVGGDWGLGPLAIGLSQNVRVGVFVAFGLTPADSISNVWHIGTSVGLRI